MARRRLRHGLSRADGYSVVELVITVGCVAALMAMALPTTASVVDASRARQAAGDIAARFRLARQRAATEGRATAVVFDQAGDGWLARTCTDGNGNGVRRAELGGPDACVPDQASLEDQYPGVAVAIDPLVPDPGGQVGNPDPVRFGAGDMASFSPAGTATAGTLYLRSAGTHYAVRIAGGNGRTRILRWDPGGRTWVDQ
ncbi:MAG TPA: GspH/FimT family pseudopilin [Planctomycetaceae bacterium]|nr:GspH/FimT family pseudopilin [Planctomycetaceae bacterium]